MIRLFRPAFNDKVVIARCPVQYWQIFSSFLIFCCYFTRLKAREISCKKWETRKIFPTLHSAPYDNNYKWNGLISEPLQTDVLLIRKLYGQIFYWPENCWNFANFLRQSFLEKKYNIFSKIGYVSGLFFYQWKSKFNYLVFRRYL